MSGHHDLGGKTGFGAVDVNEPEEAFHAPYEGRMWALSRNARAPGVTIDWWRHIRETIPEGDYLNRPYFDSWAQTSIAAFMDAGVFDLKELLDDSPAPRTPEDRDFDAFEANRKIAFSFEKDPETPPKFSIGDAVATGPAATHLRHTRLPAYAAGKRGVIHAHHGGHVFADDAALGVERGVHLYTVAFSAVELWGDDAAAGDDVLLDLWEDYLTHA